MSTATTVKTISYDALQERLSRGERTPLVNVLSEEWFGKLGGARIPGSHWIPLEEAETRFPLLFNQNDPVVVYCGGPACTASRMAADKLQALGFHQVAAYEGGLQEWVERGNRLEAAQAGAFESFMAQHQKQ